MKPPEGVKSHWGPRRMVLTYLGLALAWVLGWDLASSWWWNGTPMAWRHWINDGVAVLATTALLYVMLRRYFRMLDRAEASKRQAEDQLRHAQKMEAVGRLAGGVAHDFNNLLTAILGYTGFAISGLPEGHPARKDLEEVKKAGERASALTRQLLAFSRKQETRPVVVDVNEIVQGLQKLLIRLVGEDVKVVLQLAPEGGRTLVDPGQLEQVLMNLAVNARDAMPSGGTLTLSTAPADAFLELRVSDTGVGIAPEVKAHLFEPFFTTKEPGKGTGLGLATVYGIVTRHGGRVAVASEVGRGSAFSVFLPRVPEEVVAAAKSGGPAASLRGAETVLLVEDETVVREMIAAGLRAQGYSVMEAADGEEGLQQYLCRSHPIHAVVTDGIMPKLGGRALALKLAALQPDLVIIHISGYPEGAPEGTEPPRPLTADLRKPFASEELLGVLRRLLDRVPHRPA